MSKTVAILYGFSEGPALSRTLCKTLEARGYQVIADPKEADIIIAHSGGFLVLPENVAGKTVMLIAPACAYRVGSLVAIGLHKVGIDLLHHLRHFRFGIWFRKSLWNWWYMITEPRRNSAMYRAARVHGCKLPEINAGRVIIVCHPNDPWSGFLDQSHIKAQPGYTFVNCKGIHDDLWVHPQTFLDIL